MYNLLERSERDLAWRPDPGGSPHGSPQVPSRGATVARCRKPCLSCTVCAGGRITASGLSALARTSRSLTATASCRQPQDTLLAPKFPAPD